MSAWSFSPIAGRCRWCSGRTWLRLDATPAHPSCAPTDNPGGAPDRAVPAGVTNRRLP